MTIAGIKLKSYGADSGPSFGTSSSNSCMALLSAGGLSLERYALCSVQPASWRNSASALRNSFVTSSTPWRTSSNVSLNGAELDCSLVYSTRVITKLTFL